jgi:hypothetical protein
VVSGAVVAATVGPDGTRVGVASWVLHAAATPAVTAIAVLLAVVDKNCLRFISVLLHPMKFISQSGEMSACLGRNGRIIKR